MRKFTFSEKTIEIFIFLLAFLLFSLTLADGLNVFDFINYALNLQQSFQTENYTLPFQSFGAYGGGQGGLSRNFLFILLSYPFTFIFSNILKVDLELTLNIFSSIVTALSVLFVYKIARLFWKRRNAIFAVFIYLFIPFVFFNGTNATTYSLELLTSSIWLYFLIKGIETKDEKYGLISSVFFVANAFSSLSGTTLIFAHVYGMYKISKKRNNLLRNFFVVPISAALVIYFSFFNKAYPTTFNPLKIFFMISLFVWESVNGLSVIFFAILSVSLFYLILKFLRRKTDYFYNIFILSLVFLASSFSVFQFIPIANFITIFAFLPILIVKTFSGRKYFSFLILLILIFEIIKIAPVAYMLHSEPHPHKAYALWLNQIAQGDVVLAGHECPWLQYYTNLTFVCRARDLQSINITGKEILVTEEYFMNENQMEFGYLAKSFNLPFTQVVEEELGKPDLIANTTISKVSDYPYSVRPIEDPYQWLYTVYPKFYQSIIFNNDFLKPQYVLYEVKQ